MAKSLISKLEKRVKFKKGKQKAFFDKVILKSGFTLSKLAERVKAHPRSLSDWRREKNLMPFSVLETMCKLVKISPPKNIELKDKYWYTKIGATLGGKAHFEKYGNLVGDPERRMKNWLKWWNTEGKFKSQKILQPKPFTKPKKSIELAEFAGILMGDGGVQKYQIKISLNAETDKQYISYVVKLIQKLFNVTPAIYRVRKTKAVDISISRIGLVTFLTENLGIKKGNKLSHNLDIPEWIMKKRSYQIACVRGLVDTDGSIFQEVHSVGKKKYSYPRLNFTTASASLASSVTRIFKECGLNPKVRRGGRSIQVENKEKICEYFEAIGTNNPKHLARWGINRTIEDL